MATTATSTAVAVVDAAFSDPERFALAGYEVSPVTPTPSICASSPPGASAAGFAC